MLGLDGAETGEPLTLREAAEIAGESVRTLRRRVASGHLAAFQRGAATSPMLIERDALAAYLASKAGPSVAAFATGLEPLIRRIVREELRRILADQPGRPTR